MARRNYLIGLLWLGALMAWGPAPAAADADTDEEARALYQAGRIAFDQGRFDSALDYFQRSYELSGRPALLFNIGTAADRLRKDKIALEAFERYLEEVPDAADAASVRSRIGVLRAAVEADEAAPQAAQVEPIDVPDDAYLGEQPEYGYPSEDRAKKRKKLGWILTAAGAGVFFFVGAPLYVVGQVKRADIEQAVPGTAWSDVEGSKNADAFTATGAVLSLVGVGAAATGLVLLLKRDHAPMARSVKLAPTYGGLSLSGSF
jgi:tetratricopeptide (TPR) repeat protein